MNAPCAAAAAATWPAAAPLIAVASASCASAPSTSVQAAQLITASGRAAAIAARTAAAIGDVERAARQRGHRVAGALGGGDHVLAQHARRSGHE